MPNEPWFPRLGSGPRGPRRARHGGPRHDPGHDRGGDVGRAAGQGERARAARARGAGRGGGLAGRRRGGERVRRARAGRDGGGALRRGRPGRRPGPRAAAWPWACGLAGHGGVVKRVLPEYPQNREEFELIALRDGDRVVGAAQLSGESDELVFVTSDAQLLRFGASSVRPQGRAAGGMAGVRLVFRRVSGVVRRGGRGGGVRVAVRRAGDLLSRRSGDRGGPGRRAAGHGGGQRRRSPRCTSSPARAGPPAGSAATGSSRTRKRWSWPGPGPAPAVGATEDGSPVILPDPVGKRDGSGIALRRQLAVIGGSGRVP